jgi:hypothetical protein
MRAIPLIINLVNVWYGTIMEKKVNFITTIDTCFNTLFIPQMPDTQYMLDSHIYHHILHELS